MEDDSSQIAASLSTLPEEIILYIFLFLPPEDIMFRVRPTCRLFSELSRNPGLWNQVTVTRISTNSSAELKPIHSKYSSVRFYRNMLQQQCIRIGNNGSDSGAGATGNLHNWKNAVREVIRCLEEIGDVWPSCSVTGAMHYPNMERLTLVRENLLSVETLIRHPKLRQLKLCTNHLLDHENRQDVNGQLMMDLFENLMGLVNLQKLTLHFSCSQCMEKISHISDVRASMKDYFLTGPRLRQIELNCFVNYEILTVILDNCLQLEDLAMICPDFTPQAFCAALSGKRQLLLSALRIDQCSTLNDTCLLALSAAFPNIKSLELPLAGEVTDDALCLFLRACPQLTNLNLETSNAHKMLGGKTSENLQSLSLFRITFSSSWAFQKLCQYSRNLRKIELYYSNISNTDVIGMATICRLLESVSVYECSGVDSTGATHLMKNLPRLEKCVCKLSYPQLFQLEQLSPSRKRTRAGGLVLMNQPPTESRLCSLDLYYCQELTAVGVSALAVLYPNLRELQIRTTNCLNDHIVRVILRSLPNLQYLRLVRSGETNRENQLTADCLRYVQRWGTRLRMLHLLTRHRSFTIAALIKLLAQSSSLMECVVPCNTEKSPSTPASEIIRMVNEQHDQLQRQGKIGIHRWYNKMLDGVSVDFVGLHVFQG